jgi:metal-responsive CopG/Arc/MetJ family transcriptional regulator
MKKHLATITIMVTDRQSNAQEVQRILTENGYMIMARLGVNPQRQCIEHCTGFIAVAVEGTLKDIKGLTKKLDKLYGIVAKNCIITN